MAETTWHFDEEDWLVDAAGNRVGRFHAGRKDAGNDARPRKRDRERMLLALNAHDNMVRTLANVLVLARTTWGNLDPDANKVFEEAEAALSKAERDHG